MIRGNKGQIFSVDMILALALLFFAFALLINSIEQTQYTFDQETKFNRLNEKALLSQNIITSSDLTVCNVDINVVYDFNITALGCIDEDKFSSTSLTKAAIGLTDDVKCNISVDSSFFIDDCQDAVGTDSVVSLRQSVMTLPSGIGFSKEEWHNCIYSNPSCPLVPGVLNIKVWWDK